MEPKITVDYAQLKIALRKGLSSEAREYWWPLLPLISEQKFAMNLDGINPIIGGFVTPLVQTTLNNRVNPIQILQGKQIAINVPIASTGGNLQANVTDVRAEFKDNALNLYVIYAFNGTPIN